MALDSPDALDLESGLGFSGGDEDKPNIVGNPAALKKARSRKRRRSQREKADDSAEHAGEGKRKKKRKREQRNAESKAESSVSSSKLKKAPASGTCLMSIWTPERLLEKTPCSRQKMDTVKLSQFVVDATEDDVQQAAEQEEFFLATVGPGDFLYVPPGCLSSMQAWLWHSVLIL